MLPRDTGGDNSDSWEEHVRAMGLFISVYVLTQVCARVSSSPRGAVRGRLQWLYSGLVCDGRDTAGNAFTDTGRKVSGTREAI